MPIESGHLRCDLDRTAPSRFDKTLLRLTVFLPPFLPQPCSYQMYAQSRDIPENSRSQHMKSFRFRLLIAAMAVLLGSAIANSQTAD